MEQMFIWGFTILGGIIGVVMIILALKDEQFDVLSIPLTLMVGGIASVAGYVVGNILWNGWKVCIAITIITAIVGCVLYFTNNNNKKGKKVDSEIEDKIYKAVKRNCEAQFLFSQIDELLKSKYSSGMCLEQYSAELEQIIITVGEYNNGSFRIPKESKEKFQQVINEFQVLVNHCNTEIKRMEKEEAKRIAECNNKALDDIHALLISIKKDKIGE